MRFDCTVQRLYVIDEIDFLHEFLIANYATKLPIIFMNLRVHGETATVFQSENFNFRFFVLDLRVTQNEHRDRWQKRNVHFTAIVALPFLLFVLLLIVVASTVHLKFMQIDELPLTIRARFGHFQIMQCTVFLEQFFVCKCFCTGCALEMKLLGARVSIVVSLV